MSITIRAASETFDPEGDQLSFKWWLLPEAGTYPGAVKIAVVNTSGAVVMIPSDAAQQTLHLICEVTDQGIPRLTGCKRIIQQPEN